MSVNFSIPEGRLPELLHSCGRKEASAQRKLYDRYYPFARSIALHYANDDFGADDIVQDAFIKLFRYLEREPFAGNFESYFRRIIVNTGIDHYRSQRMRRGVMDRFFSSTDVVTNTANEAERWLERDDVHRFLQMLSPQYRMVFNLYVVEGHTHPEIAKQLGISVGTSKSNLAKARRKLRSVVGPFFQLENGNNDV